MKKFQKSFSTWLRKHKYTFLMTNSCIHCKNLKKKFQTVASIPKYKGRKRSVPVPAVFKNNVYKKNLDAEDLYEMYLEDKKKTTKKPRGRRRSSFGNYNKTTKPSGTFRNPGEYDYIPQPNWGGFSSTMGYNRAGNAIPCRESADWLYTNRSAPSFPIRRRRTSKFGKQFPEKILPTSTLKFYERPGGRPSSIYDYQQVPTKSFSPYTGSKTKGVLPRPYGPIDNASLKGYPNGLYPNSFGRSGEYGPFVNQSYRSNFGMRSYGYGPFVNQPYRMSAYGSSYGPQFKPHSKRSWKPNRNSYQSNNLYVPSWNPYTIANPILKRRQKQIKRASKKINQRYANPWGRRNSYGQKKYQISPGAQENQGTIYGPNRVAYEKSFLTYPGVGSNTINYLTGKNYLPSCRPPRNPRLKVLPNNNPNGYLSGPNVLPVSGLKYGNSKKKPRGVLFPQATTQLVGSGSSGSATSGYTRIAQPLELYTYQNTNYGSYNYPEFSGPRQWMGGFGDKRKNRKASKKKTTKKKKTKRKVKPKAGDTILVQRGKIKVCPKKRKKTYKKKKKTR